MELIIILLVFAVGIVPLWKLFQVNKTYGIVAVIIYASAIMATEIWRQQSTQHRSSRKELMTATPAARDDDYVSSTTCQGCYPNEYNSWHKTYFIQIPIS